MHKRRVLGLNTAHSAWQVTAGWLGRARNEKYNNSWSVIGSRDRTEGNQLMAHCKQVINVALLPTVAGISICDCELDNVGVAEVSPQRTC